MTCALGPSLPSVMFRPTALDETKQRLDETILGIREDVPKRLMVT
jgi:hypothetical protein